MDRVHCLDTSHPRSTPPPPRSLLLSQVSCWGGGGWSKPAWAITAVITAFFLTLQANAMWKRLIHGSQVLNTATPPAKAVIPPPLPVVCDPQQLPSLFPPQAPLSGVGGVGEEGLWLPGGWTQDVGNKGRVLRTHFIPIHNLCLNSHGIQTAAPNKAQVERCWFYRSSHNSEKSTRGSTRNHWTEL